MEDGRWEMAVGSSFAEAMEDRGGGPRKASPRGRPPKGERRKAEHRTFNIERRTSNVERGGICKESLFLPPRRQGRKGGLVGRCCDTAERTRSSASLPGNIEHRTSNEITITIMTGFFLSHVTCHLPAGPKSSNAGRRLVTRHSPAGPKPRRRPVTSSDRAGRGRCAGRAGIGGIPANRPAGAIPTRSNQWWIGG